MDHRGLIVAKRAGGRAAAISLQASPGLTFSKPQKSRLVSSSREGKEGQSTPFPLTLLKLQRLSRSRRGYRLDAVYVLEQETAAGQRAGWHRPSLPLVEEASMALSGLGFDDQL